jgi:MinD-like ATPase involved in chromosome partitioning or flagellar assembly
VREGGDAGVPVAIGKPESAAAAAFREIARRIAEKLPAQA